MLIACYLIIAANCVLCAWLFWKKRESNSPFQVLFLVILSVLLVPGFADAIAGTVSYHPMAPPVSLSDIDLFNVHVKILLMLVVFCALELFFKTPGLPNPTSIRVQSDMGLYRWIIGALIVSAPIGVLTFGTTAVSSISFENLREGPIQPFALWLFYLQLMLIGLPAYLWFWRNNKMAAVLVLVAFAAIHVVVGGSRQVPAFAFAAMIFVKLSKNDKQSFWILIVLFVFGFAAADIGLEALKLIRNTTGFQARLDALTDIFSGRADLYLAARAESGVRYIMYVFMLDSLPPKFGELQYLARTLLFWLPSLVDFFDIKPDDFEVTMFEYIFGTPIGTMHSAIFGSAYADAGALAFLWIGFIFAWMRSIELVLARIGGVELVMLWATSIYASSMIARGSLYAPIVVTAIAALVAFTSNARRKQRLDHRRLRLQRLA